MGARVAHDVFISHSTEDRKVADAICAALEAGQMRCWVAPRDIPPGAEWATSIVEAIRASSVMVMVFSEHSNHSEHVRRELTVAAEAGVVVVPLKIDKTPLEGLMEYYLADKHWLDAMNPPTKAQVAALSATVHSILVAQGGGIVPTASEDAAAATASGESRPRARAVLVGLALTIALVGAGAAVYVLLAPERGSDPGRRVSAQSTSDADSSSAEDGVTTADATPAPPRTYMQVVGEYPSGAAPVELVADITDYDVFPDGTSIVHFSGESKGLDVRGGFYLTRDFRYDGAPGILWESCGETRFEQPSGDDWTDYEASIYALVAADEVFASLYDSTYDKMLGPRFTSYVSTRIGELDVRAGDLLTFDASQHLVKVSSW